MGVFLFCWVGGGLAAMKPCEQQMWRAGFGQHACTNTHPLAPHLHPSRQNVAADIVVLTRLIPDAQGTTCNERLEPISGCRNARILRVPFRDREG